MSILVTCQVWKLSRHSGNELLMLLALADYANDNGRAYPSVATLARKCRIQVRGAQRILSVLRESGEIEVRMNGGPKGCNEYMVKVKETAATDAPLHDCAPLHGDASLHNDAPLHRKAPGGAQPCAKPLHGGAPEPSLNRQEPKTSRTRPSASASDAASLMPEVEAQTLKDWAQVRKAKRAGPITATVVKGLRSEAAKAGLTLQQVIETCCVRGWQSFKAEWATEGAGGAARPALDNSEVFT